MEWIGGIGGKGYGFIFIGQSMKIASRISYEIYFGKIPSTMHVLHKCDNPLCVAPDHLFLGSNLDNIKDRMAKGRSRHPTSESFSGKNNCNVKLTEKKVIKIRNLLADGARKVDIAKKFKITAENIRYIELKKTWKHVQ